MAEEAVKVAAVHAPAPVPTPAPTPTPTPMSTTRAGFNLGIDVLPMVTAGLILANTILMGIDPSQRQASAKASFWIFWPATKWFLQLSKAPDDVIKSIEEAMK